MKEVVSEGYTVSIDRIRLLLESSGVCCDGVWARAWAPLQRIGRQAGTPDGFLRIVSIAL